jgi:hypothetical protein
MQALGHRPSWARVKCHFGGLLGYSRDAWIARRVGTDTNDDERRSMTTSGGTVHGIDEADRQERRMVFRVTREWVVLKRQRPYPSINHLNPSTFSTDWNWCLIARSLSDDVTIKEQLEFEFVGREFQKDAPSCVAGTRLAAVPVRSRLRFAVDFMPRMFELGAALVCHGIRTWRDDSAIRYRALLLPFADNAGRPKYAAGAFSHVLAKRDISAQDGAVEALAFRDGRWYPIEEAALAKPSRLGSTRGSG